MVYYRYIPIREYYLGLLSLHGMRTMGVHNEVLFGIAFVTPQAKAQRNMGKSSLAELETLTVSGMLSWV